MFVPVQAPVFFLHLIPAACQRLGRNQALVCDDAFQRRQPVVVIGNVRDKW